MISKMEHLYVLVNDLLGDLMNNLIARLDAKSFKAETSQYKNEIFISPVSQSPHTTRIHHYFKNAEPNIKWSDKSISKLSVQSRAFSFKRKEGVCSLSNREYLIHNNSIKNGRNRSAIIELALKQVNENIIQLIN